MLFSKKILLASLVALTLPLTFGAAPASAQGGAVYAMTNAIEGNEIVVYDRGEDGGLTYVANIPTEGLGSGLDLTKPAGDIDPLASQGSLVLSQNHRFLFAVNAGSNEISSFRIDADGLTLVSKVSSRGVLPVSLTQANDLLYVLNIGDLANGGGSGANITGFTVTRQGRIRVLVGSSRQLVTAGPETPLLRDSPSQVGFTPSGEGLIVLDKGRNRFLSFTVGEDGMPSAEPVVTAAAGVLPFGFAFGPRNALLTSEVFGQSGSSDPTAASAASSYRRTPDGRLEVLTSSLPNRQTASCWIAYDGRDYAYTADSGSNTLTGYRVDRSGQMSLLDADGVTYLFPRNTTPLDLGITGDSRYLYTLNARTGTVAGFKIEVDGHLTALGEVAGVPVRTTQGLAVR